MLGGLGSRTLSHARATSRGPFPLQTTATSENLHILVLITSCLLLGRDFFEEFYINFISLCPLHKCIILLYENDNGEKYFSIKKVVKPFIHETFCYFLCRI